MPKDDPFDFVDKRIDWRPGQNRDKAGVTIREGVPTDLFNLVEILHAKKEAVYKWLHYTPWVVRLAVRNQRYPVGVVVSKHRPGENRILHWFFDAARYQNPVFPAKLFIHVALEQPEVPTLIDVPVDDVFTQQLCESLGWALDNIDDNTNTYRSEPWQPKKTD